jgi:hypothetical protein
MTAKLATAVPPAESWTVGYGDDICYDARKINDMWCYRESPEGEFRAFPVQSRVKPICTNPKKPRSR